MVPRATNCKVAVSLLSPALWIESRPPMRAPMRAVAISKGRQSGHRRRASLGFTRLERNIVVLLPGIRQLLVAQHGERAAEAAAGAVRHDDVVDEAAAAGDEG